jgi:glyoxylase-like metal-dependent hydrolase (beta-lactamase superfamily II)
MAALPPRMEYDTGFSPETGVAVPVSPGLVRVTAGNRGPYTFTGTNSFVVGHGAVAVLDPGPDEAAHLEALRHAIGGRQVTAIILTHTHRDHTGLVRRLAAETGAPLWFGGPHRLSRPALPFERNGVGRESDFALRPDRVLVDGEAIEVGGVRLTVVATPGHCANHLAFEIAGTGDLLTGDHIMGWNSTLVSVPDGSMADYLSSMRKVIALGPRRYLPAHGGPIADGLTYARALLAHREYRNDQIVADVAAGAQSIGELRRAIYPTLALTLQAAAAMTLVAHVEYLAEMGRLTLKRGLFGLKLGPA